jgi:hypothetical protein
MMMHTSRSRRDNKGWDDLLCVLHVYFSKLTLPLKPFLYSYIL